MVGSSKILTVSYGTFSCTLEGFDESFDTMKAIAEYFRDLAADDRYFGAEPPTPDADMLARIAERGSLRRVEAHSDSSGIVLRPAEDASDARAPAMPPVTQPPQAQTTAPTAAQPAAPAPVPPPAPAFVTETPAAQPAAAPTTTFDSDSVAAKLMRIRAVVGKSTASDLQESFDEDLAPIAETVTDTGAEIGTQTDTETETDEELIPVADAAEDTTDDTLEDAGTSDNRISAALKSMVEEEDEDLAVAEPTETDDEDEAPETVAQGDIATPFHAAHSHDEDVAEDMEDIEDAEIVEFEIEAEIEIEAELEHDEDAELAATTDEAAYDEFEEDTRAMLLAASARADTTSQDSDVAADVATLDGLGELEGLETVAGVPLSPEDEAALAAELAEVERSSGPAADARQSAQRRGRQVFETEASADEAAMSRIMSETDAKMKEPEANRRRDAIAHLKAAVVATEAARELGDEGDDDGEVENTFRADLNHVVRPRPAPATITHRTERPRPAPLRLVASQRVDLPADDAKDKHAVTPVRPRRVSTHTSEAKTNAPSSETTFADFAAEMGATGLADLLEAAAAYTSTIEGLEDFSRPQIMNKVRSVVPEDFSREDGLRSFGRLLREGRISKVRNGRFQISEDSRFRVEKQAAQG